jgi:hypothetical protein
MRAPFVYHTERPPRLYKYQPFKAYAIENLKSRAIWFSAPAAFNDPFDCAAVLPSTEITRGEGVRLAQELGLPPSFLDSGEPNERFLQMFEDSARKVLQEQTTISRHERGVACFSEKVDDLLMWSHYADGHRGFCLEYDTRDPAFDYVRRVSYHDSVPTLRMTDILLDNEIDVVDLVILTKHTAWSYEKEWRAIHREPNKRYGVGWENLTGIYFGAAMPDEHKEVLRLLLQGSPTKLYEMKMRDGHFGLNASG